MARCRRRAPPSGAAIRRSGNCCLATARTALPWCGWTGWTKAPARQRLAIFLLRCCGPHGSLPRMGDDRLRCWWPGEDPLYLAYHDTEWGVPEYDSRALYEKLVLDAFQAGLSWITILRKRENFRKAFHNFAPEKIAHYGGRDIDRLLKNEGIIRSRAKIEAAVKGAKLWLEDGEKEPGGFRELI